MRWFLLFFAGAGLFAQQPGWWMTEPLRWVQTNVREVDAGLDADKLVAEAARMRANVLHFNMGGIAATYPTKIQFHLQGRQLKGRDLFGEILEKAHARRIRVVGRFDFSKTRKEVYDAHPEWFFRKSNGEPVIYNELYSTCINGGWYQKHIDTILSEALEKYDVDGLFFNMFGNQSTDYSGNFVGHCHCGACKTRFRARFGRELPAQPDEDYRRWLRESSLEVAARIGELIHAKRPKAGYFNYLLEHTDGVMSESNTAVNRPLPLWPYASSDNVNRARNSQPGKASVNLCMQFVDYAWRFATVPAHEITLRLWQNIAHGGALAFAINSTFEQQDRQALEAARPVFAWAADNERYLARQESAARVLLLQGGDTAAYRGLFRLLSEEHIPFAVSNNMDWLGRREFDLVIATDRAPAELAGHVARGGRVLVASARRPEFATVEVLETPRDVKGYVRVRDTARFPSLRLTSLLLLNGPFAVTADSDAPLTLAPPSMFGPPEYIHADMRDTRTPALLALEQGRVLWLPWELGALYHRLSLPAHAGLFRDLVDWLLPEGRQLRTSAHPLVEVSLMKQDGRHLLHLMNLSGHSQTGYFPPLEMRGIEVRVAGAFSSARPLRSGGKLAVKRDGRYTAFTLPRLGDYELIVLE
jgi:hypothetical protein